MKKNNKIVALVIIVSILILGILTALFFSIHTYKYTEHFVPPSTYRVRVNKLTKVLIIKVYHSCSAVDCDGSSYKCSIKLTTDEYKKIMELWKEKDVLSPILENLCKNNKILYESFKDSLEDSIEDYNRLDLDSDGKISNREFANSCLDDAISEK